MDNYQRQNLLFSVFRKEEFRNETLRVRCRSNNTQESRQISKENVTRHYSGVSNTQPARGSHATRKHHKNYEF